jgi:anti-anti-sigma regulatory factor
MAQLPDPSEGTTSVTDLHVESTADQTSVSGLRRYALVLSVLVVGITISVAMFWTARSWETNRIENDFAITELSTPVISVWSDVLRSQQMTDRLRHSITESDAKVAIIDVTGVPTIDTAVARHILVMVAAARVLGAEVIITGFSPEAAQTIAQLGVDFSEPRTSGNLQNGIIEAFESTGLRIS